MGNRFAGVGAVVDDQPVTGCFQTKLVRDFRGFEQQVAEEFFGAWTSGNFARARELLRDDLSFDGPFDRFTDADSYLASLQQLSVIVVGPV